ncbi:hypothetical protein [Chitinophaga sp. 22620]|uniref:hypothetical protein n=1 Tax=Chitinophaga sp. 22620 TaxID=3453952 RepID=UPI003F835980
MAKQIVFSYFCGVCVKQLAFHDAVEKHRPLFQGRFQRSWFFYGFNCDFGNSFFADAVTVIVCRGFLVKQ